ncbi:unnamed protein product [Rhizophagus irregularis]|nr:unnamed protein product [Rhizophagus irregularis]
MDNFLLEAHKTIVNSEIKQHNKEKKLSKAEQASLNQDQESDTGHRKKDVENIIQMIADDSLLSLAQLFNKADDAKYGAIRTNQKEILCWYYYGKEFLTQVSVIVQDGKGKIGEKKAKG